MTAQRKLQPPKRIPVSDLAALAKKNRQTHACLMTFGPDGQTHIVTWGSTPDNCAQAAIGGNKIKVSLGWPDSLQEEPTVVADLRKRVEALQKTVNALQASTGSSGTNGSNPSPYGGSGGGSRSILYAGEDGSTR